MAKSNPASDVTPAVVSAPKESTAGRRSAPSGAAAVHHNAGNRAAATLLMVAQPKLTVGPAGDQYEREADTVADQVVAALAARTQTRRSSSDPSEPSSPAIARQIQRLVAPTDEATVGAQGGALDAGVESQIQSARSGGTPLDSIARSSMEGAFGSDFSRVRIHTGSNSAALNRSISAKAFTIGSDIFFGAGKPDTSTKDGQQLLAHELTHTVQQTGGSPSIQRWSLSLFGKKKDPKPPTAEEVAIAKEDAETKRLAAEAAAGSDHRDKLKAQVGTDPKAQKLLAARFQKTLGDEMDLRASLVKSGKEPDEAETLAYAQIWLQAPEDLRSIRPMRETGAEKLVSKTTEMRNNRSVIASQTAERAKEQGAFVSKPVEKLILEELELIKTKMAGGEPESRAKILAYKEMKKKTDAELWAKRPAAGSKTEAEAYTLLAKRIPPPGKEAASTILDTVVGIGTGVTGATGASGKAASTSSSDNNDKTLTAGEMEGNGVSSMSGMISSIFETIGAINTFVEEINKSRTSKQSADDISAAIRSATAVLSSLNGAVSNSMKFAGSLSESSLASVADMLPIVDVIANSLALVDGIASTVPAAMRYGGNAADLFAARAADKPELIMVAKRLGQRNTQLLEIAIYKTLSAATKLGLGIAQIATAGADFGASTILKYCVKGLDTAHTLAHTIADNVFAVEAKKARGKVVEREEGSAEELLRRDAGYAVDALIMAALKGDKKVQELAKQSLLTSYGVTFTTGDAAEQTAASERILTILQESSDPKTTLDKMKAGFAKLSVMADGMSDKSADVATLAGLRNAQDKGTRGFGWRMKMWFKSEGAIARRIAQHNVEHATSAKTNKQVKDVKYEAKADDPQVTKPDTQETLINKMLSMSTAELTAASKDEKRSEFERLVFAQAAREKLAEEMKPAAASTP